MAHPMNISGSDLRHLFATRMTGAAGRVGSVNAALGVQTATRATSTFMEFTERR
eukprot:CAMPEP_0183350358 /NCGR_PEP_ID=MMETSP0164_2-20130417/18451_1 /TAXON_ID=221442 /ORGANISM="Coccolithus pelagicus ssp braarudi, Strain PLY182g" /LENGTH=53 /DNA_ID=CAMNT_0025522263 /DNA_START=475 /DNA_END=632 /DNA_ORIENTATION=-